MYLNHIGLMLYVDFFYQIYRQLHHRYYVLLINLQVYYFLSVSRWDLFVHY